MRHNPNYHSISEIREKYQTWLNAKTLLEQIVHAYTHQTEFMLVEERYPQIAKILHPLFIKGYRTRMVKHTDKKLNLIGLDIETVHTTGEPRLIGVWNENTYSKMLSPTDVDLYNMLRETNSNGYYHYVTWGQLDIQCIMRLFMPTEPERKMLSRGISGKISRTGDIHIPPPIARQIGESDYIYVMHYIPRRALRIGWLENGFFLSRWIFNLAQFYQTTIAIAAKGTGLQWQDYAKSTHLIDWRKYRFTGSYREQVNESNKQDARIVTELANNLLDRFYETFKAYPTLLVSTGSLTDAAVSVMLDEDDYNSNAWSWLVHHVWQGTDTTKAETLLAEAFSAGYVDQHAIGYIPQAFTADISAAYPFQIRKLPDLRYAHLYYGKGDLPMDLAASVNVESAIIRGCVTIPQGLVYHPITIKNVERVNIRPQGTFYATYTLEERDFCESYGATFENEEYVIITLNERHTAPIAGISQTLGEMRDDILREIKTATTDRKTVLDGQQYIVKVIDNSIYGKTVMLTESVIMQGDEPVIEGYVTGDRYNLLYGTLITARTRTLLANAAMRVYRAGGHVVLLMTDSLYWTGSAKMLPSDMIARKKTAGYFEPPTEIHDLFLLKTGLYEYRDTQSKWHYKLRGFPVIERPIGNAPFLRDFVLDYCRELPMTTKPQHIKIPIETKRLVTIGAKNLEQLGLVKNNQTSMKPFVLGAKYETKTVDKWRATLNGSIRLNPIQLALDEPGTHTDTPMAFLRDTYEGSIEARQQRQFNIGKTAQKNLRERKQFFVVAAMLKTGKSIAGLSSRQPDKMTWEQLETYFEVTRDDIERAAYQLD